MTQHEWVWPTSEALHFLGMSLMFGTLLIVSLRLMGGMRSMSFAAAHRLLPFGVLGFAINVVTGMLFFIGAPEQYVDNVSFHWKVILLELIGACFLLLTVYDITECGDHRRGPVHSATRRAVRRRTSRICRGRESPRRPSHRPRCLRPGVAVAIIGRRFS